MSSAARLFAVEVIDFVVEPMDGPERLPALRLVVRHRKDLAAVGMLDEFGRDVTRSDDVAGRFVADDLVRTGRPRREGNGIARLELALPVGSAKRRVAMEHQ